VTLPATSTRAYGFPNAALERTLGLRTPSSMARLFVHPQSQKLYAREIAAFGSAGAPRLCVTPTASYRSLLAWRAGAERRAAVIKTSLPTVIARKRRTLPEHELACGLVVSRVLDTIPEEHKKRLGFDWFSETAGVVLAKRRHGWLLRTLPELMLAANAPTTLVPAFSLISRRGDEPPLLVELIRRSGKSPERFVAERVLLPYINVLSYLLFDQGISCEAHSQNVLFETSADTGELTGRLVLRDFADASVNIPLRVARRKPLPSFRPGFFPRAAPFPVVSAAADHFRDGRRPGRSRARQTVERAGLIGFVWAINHCLGAFFPGCEKGSVTSLSFKLWQRAALRYLGITPLIDAPRCRIAIDQAIRRFLALTDWSALGAEPRQRLPKAAEALVTGRRAQRRPSAMYTRIRTGWGDLYLDDNQPSFFCPAF
jgi:hypothetical protein